VGEGLDESVINTVRTWKFKPAMKKGKPVPVKVHLQVNFRLS
jgi:TonB family protein